jgi:TP901 family phage tail tape measure protein
MAYDLVARLRLVDNMTDPLKKATKGLRGISLGIGSIGTGLAGLGAAVGGVAVVANSLDKAMAFEKQIDSIASLDSRFQDLHGNIDKSGKAYGSLQALALKLGATTSYSALEAAQGMEELVKAGMPLQSVLNGGAQAALNLAAAGGVDVAKAAEVLAVSVNAFGNDQSLKGVNGAATAANILAGTANAAATDVAQLKYGISAVGAVANGLGLDFKDTASAIGLFTNAGLEASDAGTSLKTFLSYLKPTTKTQIALMDKLGLVTKKGNAFYQNGKIKDLASIADTLRVSLKKLNQEQRNDVLKEIFGQDGIRAGQILFEQGAEGVKKFQTEMAKTNALEMAKQKMNNAAGAVEQFKGALETLQISALLPTMPIIKNLATRAADFVGKYTPQITAAIQGMVDTGTNYFNSHFLNNPEFQNLPTIPAKINFVFQKIMDAFNTWYADKGSQDLTNIANKIGSFLGTALKGASKPIITAATQIGKDLGNALINGLNGIIKDHPILGGLAVGAATPGPLPVKVLAASAATASGATQNVVDQYKNSGLNKWVTDAENKLGPKIVKIISFGGSLPDEQPNSKSGGIDRVPYNGYLIRAHKDEAVLTASEADDRRNGRGGNSFTFGDVHINGASGNVAQMADDLMREIARRVSEAGGQMS